MPIRSNQFQKLVHLIERQLSGIASVQQCAELVDQQNGETREVDVLITVECGDHLLRIGVEATDCRAGTPWVESMVTKHKGGMLTDRQILVAADGFTPGAIKKAKAYNVTLVALGSAETLDWAKTVGKYASLWFGMVDLSPETVTLTVTSQEGSPPLVIGPDTMLVSKDRSKQASLLGFVHQVLKSRNILKDVYDRADREDLSEFTAEGSVDEEIYALDGVGGTHLVTRFRIEGGLKFAVSEFQVQKSAYRGAAVGHGEFDIANKKAVVAIIEKEGQEATFSVNLAAKDNDPGTVVDLGS